MIVKGEVTVLKIDGLLFDSLDLSLQVKLKDKSINVFIKRNDAMNEAVLKLE